MSHVCTAVLLRIANSMEDGILWHIQQEANADYMAHTEWLLSGRVL